MGGGSWIDYMKRELHKDDVEFDASESIPYLEWSTEYIVYTYGMNSAGTKTTPVYTKTFKTLDPAPSNNQITTNVKKVYKDGADVEVTTTNDDTYYINVSSTNSEQSKLCINGPLYIDARFLRKQAIGCNGT